ncbi:MAG: diguanylate cyclase [Pirellulaceae bacterium]|nr:diguanylate cyclase [Pirellulaceae bacterium]
MLTDKPEVLLVDDDPAMLRLLERWLTSKNYPVAVAQDGLKAIEHINYLCPRILITDWDMPEFDGIELCRWLRRQQLPHYVYVVFLTGRCHSQDIIRGLEAGADDFLKKPVDREELLARLEAAIRVLAVEHRLTLMTQCDPLTGLPSYRVFKEKLPEEWQRAHRYGYPLSVALLSIDSLKEINSQHGRTVGNFVLQRFADLLQQNSRTSDTICRTGEKEFCILLPEAVEEAAATWAERIRRILSQVTLSPPDSSPFSFSVSVGISDTHSENHSSNQLLEEATEALRIAKKRGRNCVVCASELSQKKVSQNALIHLLNCSTESIKKPLDTGVLHSTTLAHAIDYLYQRDLTVLPIVDNHGALLGTTDSRYLLKRISHGEKLHAPISRFLRPNIQVFEEETSLVDIVRSLQHKGDNMVLLTKNKRPSGFFKINDLLQSLAKQPVSQ